MTSGSSKLPPDVPKPPTVGLILTGGGSRAAYQVGVLRAVHRIRREAGGRYVVLTGGA